MQRWSFHSQVFFLSKRLLHHRQLLDHPHSVIQDRTVYEDAEIFACNLYERNAMTERDYQTYRGLYTAVASILPPPDLVIYLRASIPTLFERIRRRNRPYERNISEEYLSQLNELYEAWMQGFTLCPVLTVPADRLDFVSNGDHLTLITEKILERLQGKELVTFGEGK
jgi:deoxyadenosine/deoxycytidine kinase